MAAAPGCVPSNALWLRKPRLVSYDDRAIRCVAVFDDCPNVRPLVVTKRNLGSLGLMAARARRNCQNLSSGRFQKVTSLSRAHDLGRVPFGIEARIRGKD